MKLPRDINAASLIKVLKLFLGMKLQDKPEVIYV
jgi:hypothetical protein